jgi:hypothetical protein
MGLRAGLDIVSRKIPIPRREPNPDNPTIQPVASRYADWAITAHYTQDVHFLRRKLYVSMKLF